MRKRKRIIDTLLDHFWNRWRREYITSLREVQRRVKKTGGEKIQEGDIVLVFDEKAPRHLWRKGKVERLIVGQGNVVRGAVLKIGKTGTTMKRPVNKLYPLLQYKVPNEDCNEACKNNRDNVETVRQKNTHNVGDNIQLRGETSNVITRARREAAIVGELRRKLAC